MATIKRFEEIKAWQKARVLNGKVGEFIDKGQFKRNYRLIDQIEGSAGSIMDNIAEGFERSGNKEFIHSYMLQKDPAGNFAHKCIKLLTENILVKLSLTICTKWQ
jgi:four helix bundle protein